VSATDILAATVTEVLAANPDAAQVFVSRAMACPGCPFAAFETVSQVATVYGCDAVELANALAAAKVDDARSRGVGG
jgi:hybrid cluster-associated redox disulfide protein